MSSGEHRVIILDVENMTKQYRTKSTSNFNNKIQAKKYCGSL